MEILSYKIPMLFVAISAVVIIFGITVALILTKRSKTPKSHNATKSVSNDSLTSDIILSAIEDGVMVMAPDKTIRVFNPGAIKITGWPAEEAIGLDHHLVLKIVNEKGEVVKPELNPVDLVFNDKTNRHEDKLFLETRSQKRISLGLSVSPLLNNSELSGVVVIFRDISEQIKEQQRRAEFISTASHEMRTPVAAIEGYLALALNENVSKIDAKAREYLDKAHSSTEHLGKLFQDLLTSARAEDGRLANHPSVVEMGAFMEQLADDLRFAAQKKNLLTEFIIGTADSTIDASNPSAKVVRPLYYVYIDPDRMREVVTNLFDNAVKYTDSGKISIGITGDDKIVQIRVSDTGPGIAAEDVPHLFDKFYRVDSSATRTIGGTGLGLFICRKIVELYNGRIWVDSTEGKGSIFFVNLPRMSTQNATNQQNTDAVSNSPLGSS